MDNYVVVRLIDFISKNDLMSCEKISIFRKLGTVWKKSIEDNFSELRSLANTYRFVENCLEYNMDDYDKNCYKRKIMSNLLNKTLPLYSLISIPFVEEYSMDFLDEGIQYVVERKKLPNEFYILLNIYKKYPSVIINIYPYHLMKKIIEVQTKWVENKIINISTDDDIRNLLMFLPICYTKYYSHQEDDNHITVLCYVNVLDKELERDFPYDYERYYSIKIPIETYTENHFDKLMSHILDLVVKINENNIVEYHAHNIASELIPFQRIFTKLLNTSNFHL